MFPMMFLSIPLRYMVPVRGSCLQGMIDLMSIMKKVNAWQRAAAGIAVSALILAGCGEGDINNPSIESPGQNGTDEPSPSETEDPEEPDDDMDHAGGEPDRDDFDDDDVDGEVFPPATGTTQSDAGDVTVTDHGVKIGVADAPFEVTIFADPLCPYCAQLNEVMELSAQEWAQGSDVSVEHITVTFLDDGSRDSYSARAANILAAVADHDPVNWVAAANTIFEMQPEAGASVSQDEVLNALESAGVSVDAALRADVSDMKYDNWNLDVTKWASEDQGVVGVPTVLVNGAKLEGYQSFEELVEMINDAVASN